MNSEYRKLAYEKAVLSRIYELGKDALLPTDGDEHPRERLVSEDLPLNAAEVPEDAVHDVLARVHRLAQQRQRELEKFTMSRDTGYHDEWEAPSEKESNANPAQEETAKGGGGAKEAREASAQRKAKSGRSRRKSTSTEQPSAPG